MECGIQLLKGVSSCLYLLYTGTFSVLCSFHLRHSTAYLAQTTDHKKYLLVVYKLNENWTVVIIIITYFNNTYLLYLKKRNVRFETNSFSTWCVCVCMCVCVCVCVCCHSYLFVLFLFFIYRYYYFWFQHVVLLQCSSWGSWSITSWQLHCDCKLMSSLIIMAMYTSTFL